MKALAVYLSAKFCERFRPLKVHKIDNFLGSDFEFCTILLLVLLKD
jgi:hypothetical protein